MRYFDDVMNVLNNSIKNLNEDCFEKLLNDCNKTLNNGGKIIVSGLGKNVCICDKFVGAMVSLGMNAYFLHTNSAVHGDLGLVKENDLVIILTKSGETVESVYLAEKLKNINNVNLWLLTFNEESTLTKMIDNKLVLQLDHEGDMWDILPINSTTLNLIVLQVLAVELSKLQNVQIAEVKKNHPGGNIGQILLGEKD